MGILLQFVGFAGFRGDHVQGWRIFSNPAEYDIPLSSWLLELTSIFSVAEEGRLKVYVIANNEEWNAVTKVPYTSPPCPLQIS